MMLEPGQELSVTTWGNLGKEDIARKGLESFMGMVSHIHPDCSHWWCEDTLPNLILMVEFYYSSHEVQNFIGAYICPSQRGANGAISFAEPLQKILIQPLSIEGYTSITIGSIDQTKVKQSDIGRGPIDRRTAEVLMLVPTRPVPNIPVEPTPLGIPPRFIINRENGVWNLLRVIHNNDEIPVEYRGFVSLPAINDTTKVVVEGLDDFAQSHLTLHETYYKSGFFNVSVDFDHYVRHGEGSITLVLGEHRSEIEAQVNRTANRNGTARVMGGVPLRDWFQRNYSVGDRIPITFATPTRIILGQRR